MEVTQNQKRTLSWETLPHITSFLTVLAYIGFGIFVIFQWNYFSKWLQYLKDLEINKDGVKIARYEQAQADIANYAKTKPAADPYFDQSFAQAAVIRAARVAPALKGALILWIDDDFAKTEINEANKLVTDVLNSFGVRIVHAKSSAEAQQRIDEGDRYDLIVSSSLSSSEPNQGPLLYCKVEFFTLPYSAPPQFYGDVKAYTESFNMNAPGGFTFIDHLKQQQLQRGSDDQQVDVPPVIFFSASTGGIARNFCARVVTNRVDVLLQNIVSVLEESRWSELSDPTLKK